MKCPACGTPMEEMSVDNIKLDVCTRGCGGVWFDRFELQRVDESHESAGERLLDLETEPNVVVDHTKKRKCPRCKDVVLMRHYFSVKKEIEVDECPSCAGVWVDSGELRKIRNQFATEAERDKAAQEYFADVFGNEMQMMKEEGGERLEKAKKFARLFRFICPSYYIPGKQSGGAF
jgi:Zn-finger nucleic acid-binding protein